MLEPSDSPSPPAPLPRGEVLTLRELLERRPLIESIAVQYFRQRKDVRTISRSLGVCPTTVLDVLRTSHKQVDSSDRRWAILTLLESGVRHEEIAESVGSALSVVHKVDSAWRSGISLQKIGDGQLRKPGEYSRVSERKLAAFLEKWNTLSVAEHAGKRQPQSIRVWAMKARKQGLPVPRKKGGSRLTPQARKDYEDLAAIWDQGLSMREMSRILLIPVRRLYKIAKHGRKLFPGQFAPRRPFFERVNWWHAPDCPGNHGHR